MDGASAGDGTAVACAPAGRWPQTASCHGQTLRDQVLAGDGTRFLGLRSCGPIAVSTGLRASLAFVRQGFLTAPAAKGWWACVCWRPVAVVQVYDRVVDSTTCAYRSDCHAFDPFSSKHRLAKVRADCAADMLRCSVKSTHGRLRRLAHAVRPTSGGGFGLAAKPLICSTDSTPAVAPF